MKLMTHTRAAMLSLIFTGAALAGGEGWTTNYEAAKKEAASSKKSLLIDFTGSDWCGWCIKLNDEVFKHDTFKNGVKDKFILVELDFPNDKSNQSEAVQKQNQELAKQYGIEGFPTILLTDEEGRPFASTGYKPGGPGEYVAHLDSLLEKRKQRDEGLVSAAKLEGPAKAKALIGVLDTMELSDGTISGFYGSTVDEIIKADPEDSSGFAKKLAAKERMAKFDAELNSLGEKKDFDGALALIENTLKEELFIEDKQRVTLMKSLVMAEQGKFDEAIKIADEAKKIAPESEAAGQIDGLKRQLEAMKGHDKAE
jgi:thioredoxin-related protein